eukprot:Nk52_evm7s470 gene=Nk52_evmTU7s470
MKHNSQPLAHDPPHYIDHSSRGGGIGTGGSRMVQVPLTANIEIKHGLNRCAKWTKHWFLFALVLVIILAKMNPRLGKKGGVLKPEVTVSFIAVFVIFFNSGLGLKTSELAKAAMNFRLHFFVQGFTLVFIPIFMSFLVQILSTVTSLNIWLLRGLAVVGCMPPPVSSAVILTRAGNGNEAAAIFNSAFGSIIGIFATPLLLMTFVDFGQAASSSEGGTATAPVGQVFGHLFVTVVLPLIIGQVVRFFFWHRIERLKLPFGTISSCVLLLIIYTTFCETFLNAEGGGEGDGKLTVEGQVDLEGTDLLRFSDVVKIIIIVFLCQTVFIYLAFVVSKHFLKRSSMVVSVRDRLSTGPDGKGEMLSLSAGSRFDKVLAGYMQWPGFTRSDIVAIVFCSTHKSLTLGIPMLKILFADKPFLSTISIPLLAYHPLQILVGGLVVPLFAKWKMGDDRFHSRV